MSRFSCLLVIAVLQLCMELPAQDMRVRSTISQVDETGRFQPFAYILTLFHSGKVYDYMEDVGEVVIYEPMNDRFILLDGDYRVAFVSITEVNQFLKVSQAESDKYLSRLQQDGSDTARQQADALKFLMHPQFVERFDAKDQRLRMSSSQIDYTIKTGASPNPEQTLKYLAYADWAARLNHILHPEALLPEARLVVNASLRKRKRLPLEVELRFRSEKETPLRAEHQFSWELQATDKRQITLWEERVTSKEAVQLTFRDYQRKLLTSK